MFDAEAEYGGTDELRSEWDWGDGTGTQGLSVTHRYSEPGTYDVEFTAFASSDSTSDNCTVTVVGTPVGPADVAGTYDFTQLRFDPDITGLRPISVLDTLVLEETALRLAENSEFQLTYLFNGAVFSEIIRGTFEVGIDSVALSARSTDVDLLASLLLFQGVSFQRESEDVLSLNEDLIVDLEAYDEDVYGGIGPQPGTLSIRLERRALDPVAVPLDN